MKRMHIVMAVSICFIGTIECLKKQPTVSNQDALDANSLLATIQKELGTAPYREDILPHNLSYMTQLLDYGKRTKQSREYTQNVFSLFSKLLKGADYINAYVFTQFCQEIPRFIKHHFSFIKTDSPTQQLALQDMDILERFEKTVSGTLYTNFQQNFTLFQTNPEQFLDTISTQIVGAAQEEISMELLRQTIIRFTEVGLSKMIWSSHQYEHSWDNVKAMSAHLAALLEHNILSDMNDLDELYWTLTHRYRYFLELNSVDMPLSFYDTIKHDIANGQLMLFDLEEQETFLQSKADCLLHTVITQEAKKRAYDIRMQETQVM